MRRHASLVIGLVATFALLVACQRAGAPPVPPAAQPAPAAWQAPGEPQLAGGGQSAAPPMIDARAAAPARLATPGPTALGCQNDAQCITHRCNTAYGRCAFPCVSDDDCIPGTTCLVAAGPLAACVPKPPGAE